MRAGSLSCALTGALLAAVLALTATATARAATVTVRAVSVWYFGELPAMVYDAAPGERNTVTVTGSNIDGTRVRLHDPGAVITATGRCRTVDPHTAVCRGDPLPWLRLGDLDDQFTGSRREDAVVEVLVDGGNGNDTLTGGVMSVALRGGLGADRLTARSFYGNAVRGGPGDDQISGEDGLNYINGGPGNDQINGGPGVDLINGGGGRDQLFGGGDADTLTDGDRDGAAGDLAPGPDLIVGGENGSFPATFFEDTISYRQRTRPVRVQTGNNSDAGEPGEHDTISGIAGAVGGAGDDHLIGDHRSNSLDGGAGDDLLIGRRGGDSLTGGADRDRLIGGRSGDVLAGGTGADTLRCGDGRDTLVSGRTGFGEIIPAGCERLNFTFGSFFTGLTTRAHLTGTGRPWWLALRTFCPDLSDDLIVTCHGTVSVRERARRHRLLARGSFTRSDVYGVFAVPLALTALGWRWRHGQLPGAAVVRLHMRAEGTPRRPFTWTLPSRGRR